MDDAVDGAGQQLGLQLIRPERFACRSGEGVKGRGEVVVAGRGRRVDFGGRRVRVLCGEEGSEEVGLGEGEGRGPRAYAKGSGGGGGR